MDHAIVKPSFVRTDARGTFTEVLNSGQWGSLLTGSMNAGARLGDHYHLETDVFFFLTAGEVTIRTLSIDTQERAHFQLQAGEGVVLVTRESHVIEFTTPGSFIMLKSNAYDPANPDTYELRVD